MVVQSSRHSGFGFDSQLALRDGLWACFGMNLGVFFGAT
jgi:hypothetical protein